MVNIRLGNRLNAAYDSETGFTLEVDVYYPLGLRDQQRAFPLAPMKKNNPI